MDTKQIARILRETAQLLEIDGRPYRPIRSYEKGAELIDGLPESIEQLAKERKSFKETTNRRPHGRAAYRNVKDRRLCAAQKLLKKYPVTILDLLHPVSWGPKKVAFCGQF